MHTKTKSLTSKFNIYTSLIKLNHIRHLFQLFENRLCPSTVSANHPTKPQIRKNGKINNKFKIESEIKNEITREWGVEEEGVRAVGLGEDGDLVGGDGLPDEIDRVGRSGGCRCEFPDKRGE